MIKKGSQELKDLDVDRIDGVDRPATGRSFLLFKSEGGEDIMKGYGLTATAAAAVLTKMRTDANAVVSRSSAIALNGLAQVLGQDPVFVGKSVPTQPYVFTEPDADKRGPADEGIGGNFTPRSMPGSMVGSVQFRMKDADADEVEEEASKTAKSAAKAAADKAKAKDEPEPEPDKDDKPWMARSLDAMAKAIGELPGQIVKGLIAAEKAEIAKMEGRDPDEAPAEDVRKAAKSRQITQDEPVSVRKGAGGYEPRMAVGFGDVVFGGKR